MKVTNILKKYPKEKLLFDVEEKDAHSVHAHYLLKADLALKEKNKEGNLLEEASNLPCIYCKKSFKHEELTIDHVQPRYFRGTNDPENLELCCEPCNKAKGGIFPEKMPVTFKKWLKLVESGIHPRRLPFLEKVLKEGGFNQEEKFLIEKLIRMESRVKKK